MKNIKLFVAIAALVGVIACNPIEDQTLRDKYITNAGEPISKADLTAALSVTQPGETDDYVEFKLSRKDIGGAWHIGTNAGETIIKNDVGSYTYGANGEFEIYYRGISEGQIVESEHFPIKVTSVYDPWAGILTGAKDNKDTGAKKTWGFWPQEDAQYVCCMIAHGYWKYYAPEKVTGNAWWGQATFSDAGDQKMTFEYAGSKMTTYNADGSVKASGAFAFNHESPEDGAMGTLITTAPLIGAAYDDCGQGDFNEFYLLTFDAQHMTIYHNGWGGASDWDDCGYAAYFQAK